MLIRMATLTLLAQSVVASVLVSQTPGATTLYATSWTAELLAPAYKKSISVLEKGATVTLADGTTSAAEPFDGSINKVIFNATKAGNYTIVYRLLTTQVLRLRRHLTLLQSNLRKNRWWQACLPQPNLKNNILK